MIPPSIGYGAGLTALALTATIAATAPAPSAAADTAQTKVATVARERGTVAGIADGDTFFLNQKEPSARIRLSGIQTTEIAHKGTGRNWCHGLQAKNRLSSLMMSEKVMLKSLYPGSTSWDGRRLRYAFVPNSSGTYIDVQQVMLREGHALWKPSATEWANNYTYHVLAAKAAAARRSGSLWDTDMCGYGPNQGAALSIWINWDAPGDDNANPNGEYVAIANNSSYNVSLSGWYVRQSSHATYTFPSGSYVPRRSVIKLHVGRGTRTRTDYYWGLSSAVFPNDQSHGMGSSAYLLDPQGDFRAWYTYPCVYRCS